MEEIINKVAQSKLVNVNLDTFYDKSIRTSLDLKDFLWNEMILKERYFREQIKEHKWEQYRDQSVAINCSVDTIIPEWAYILMASKLDNVASFYCFGNKHALEINLFQKNINQHNWEQYNGKKILINGCGDYEIPSTIYIDVFKKLKPYADSIMFGEACSSVPIWKKPKN